MGRLSQLIELTELRSIPVTLTSWLVYHIWRHRDDTQVYLRSKHSLHSTAVKTYNCVGTRLVLAELNHSQATLNAAKAASMHLN